jgi:hypothetical protein
VRKRTREGDYLYCSFDPIDLDATLGLKKPVAASLQAQKKSFARTAYKNENNN